MSRPQSRSGHPNNAPAPRPSSALARERPSSIVSRGGAQPERPSSRASTSTLSQGPTSAVGPPATPRAAGAARYGGLSAKQEGKITSTLANIRKNAPRPDPIAEASFTVDGKGKAPARPTQGAYLASARFAAAPLNSRVVPASPHRTPARAAAERGRRLLARDNSLEASSDDEDQTQVLEDSDEAAVVTRESLSNVPLDLQEALIVEDLLYVLMGIEGERIDFDADYSPDDELDRLRGPGFVVDDTLDPSLRALVERILPLATHYTAIDTFVQRQSHLEFGLSNHALCAAIRDVLKDYLILIAQLEHAFNTDPAFTLQRLWLHVHPTLHTLALIHGLTTELLHMPVDEVSSSSDDEDLSSESDDSLDGIGAEAVKAVLGAGRRKGRETARTVWEKGGPVKGGEVLTVIEERLHRMSGDPRAVELYSKLFLHASQPYARILLDWITNGHLVDPHLEFLIRESPNVSRAEVADDNLNEYWEKRYVIQGDGQLATRDEARQNGRGGGAIVPKCLTGWRKKILLAGKYLNVVRECGIEIKVEEQVVGQGELVSITDDSFYARIDAAYTAANKTLLQLLLRDHNLLDRLKSLKHHFFLDQADTLAHFLDSAATELAKKARSANVARLQTILDLALRNPATASSTDPYKEDVKVDMTSTLLVDWVVNIVGIQGATVEEDMIEAELAAAEAEHGRAPSGASDRPSSAQSRHAPAARVASTPMSAAGGDKPSITALEALTIDYSVPFPLSLVISRPSILRYQLLFRHLLALHVTHQSLQTTWLEHTKAACWRKRTDYEPLERWKGRVFALRMKMLAFVRQVHGFMVYEVLEPRWRQLIKRLEKIETVDELIRQHGDFLDTCLRECFLSASPNIMRTHSKLLFACNAFVKYTKDFTRSITQMITVAEANGGDWSETNLDKQSEILRKFEDNFAHNSTIHLDYVQYAATSDSTALLPLVVRLSSLRPRAQDPYAL